MKIKEIWINPVWSNVIAAVIIALLAAIGRLLYSYISPLFENLKSGFFNYKYFSLIFVIVIMSFIAFLLFILLGEKRKLLFAKKYSNNPYFYKLFSNKNSGENVYPSIAHESKVISLLENLKSDKIIMDKTDNYPKLTSLGIKIKEYSKKKNWGNSDNFLIKDFLLQIFIINDHFK